MEKNARIGTVSIASLLLFGLFASPLSARKKPDLEKLLREGKAERAREACAELKGFEAAWGWPLLGDHHLERGELEQALECYEKGIPAAGLARTWARLGAQRRERGDQTGAREAWGKSLEAWETLIRDDRCVWEAGWEGERLEARKAWLELGGEPGPAASRERLRGVLDHAASYCRRLEGTLLEYICEEEVEQAVDLSHPMTESLLGLAGSPTAFSRGASRDRTRHLYDYQLVNEGDSIRERRFVLARSGKTGTGEIGTLFVGHYALTRMIYAPIGIFTASRQALYDFRLLEERRDGKGPLLVVEALPLRSPSQPLSFGRAWLREDGRVERLEINFKSFHNYEQVLRTARDHGLVPAITFEMGFETLHRGIGFPSVFRLRDLFRDANGRESTVSDITITYGQYRFFKVEARETIR